MKELKKWNWSLLFIIMCITTIGTLGNKTIESTSTALLIGGITGLLFGLPFAWITKD